MRHLLPFTLLITGLLTCQTFQDFLNQVNAAPNDLKVAIVDSFMTVAPSFPFVENDTLVHYIYRSAANSAAMAGDATNWSPDVGLIQLAGTDFWYYSRMHESDARLDYKYVINDVSWILDPLNPHQIPSGFGNNSELRMPDWTYPQEINEYTNIPHGTTEDTLFYSIHLGNSRTVRIYLPPGYFATERQYPTVLFHDGLEYISLARADNVFDYLLDQQLISPVIGIFVPPIERTREYAGDLQDEFTAFVVEELLPWVDSRYRTIADPDYRATIGASNGGNIALWLAYDHPEVFGNVAAQSSNVQSSISQGFENGPVLDMEIYLDIGTYDIPILIPLVENLEAILNLQGYNYEYHVYHEGHSWGNWCAHMDDAFIRFFPYDPYYCTNMYGAGSFSDDCGICSSGTSGHEPNSDLDECGVCFGDDSCMGCTDPEALNYNPWSTWDDGSCEYPQTVILSIGRVDENARIMEIWLENPGPVSCHDYQFVIDGIALTGATGGMAMQYGYITPTGANGVVIGFNLVDQPIPPGVGVLTFLSYSETIADTSCIHDAIISAGSPGEFIETDYGSCFPFGAIQGCMDLVAMNFDPEVEFDDHSCEYGILGDVNLTGDLDILDLVIMVMFILDSTHEITPYEFWASDLNQDGTCDILDIVMVVDIIMTVDN
ncbi:MAG: hypothetical protein HQ510_04070 [Candidatus Marinimicrobia bacterium]|nr:hypothetical protein [Candidatus Neomarinimicrobiota bacterium]